MTGETKPVSFSSIVTEADTVARQMADGTRSKDDAFLDAKSHVDALPSADREIGHEAVARLAAELKRLRTTAGLGLSEEIASELGEDAGPGEDFVRISQPESSTITGGAVLSDTSTAGIESKITIPGVADGDQPIPAGTTIENRIVFPPQLAKPEGVTGGMVYICIGISMLLMFLVGSLSLFYTKGVSLLTEIETLDARQPDRRFGQLERQLLVAQEQLFALNRTDAPLALGTGGTSAADSGVQSSNTQGGATPVDSRRNAQIDDLARESAYAIMHELRDLNFALKSIEGRVAAFENEAQAPLAGISGIRSFSRFLAAKLEMPVSPAKAAVVALALASGSLPAESPNLDAIQHLCSLPVIEAKNPPGSGPTPPPSSPLSNSYVLGMDMNKFYRQACKYNLNYVSISVPSADLWAHAIKERISPYAMWILPCLYAALGSMLYFMRLILDQSQVNPPVFRIVHRVALAALAGMILAWFWEPTFGRNAEFQSIGFGLFTLAFIVGFSIDVFFTLLDRLVNMSNAAISKLGA